MLIEGASVGRALITSDIHGCKETLKDGESGFLVPLADADALYCSMMAFYNMSLDEKRQMGLNGHKYVSEGFNRSDVVKFTVDTLREGLK